MIHRRSVPWAVAILAAALRVPAQTPDARQFAPTGTLRVTFLKDNAVQGKVDANGTVTGPVADITRELARRLGVPFQITPAAGVRPVLDSVKMHTADLAFLAFDATRAAEVDFTQNYELAYNSYLVRSDSPLRKISDGDRPGMRIAARKGDSGELYLSRTLKQAEVKAIPGLDVADAQKMLANSEIDAFATNRERLVAESAAFPNVRVLPDNFFAVEQALIVEKGNAGQLAYLNRLIDDLRASGFLQAAIDRARLHGVDVAPPSARENSRAAQP
jgi:polar amino acid transport system substrate-binding protein